MWSEALLSIDPPSSLERRQATQDRAARRRRARARQSATETGQARRGRDELQPEPSRSARNPPPSGHPSSSSHKRATRVSPPSPQPRRTEAVTSSSSLGLPPLHQASRPRTQANPGHATPPDPTCDPMQGPRSSMDCRPEQPDIQGPRPSTAPTETRASSQVTDPPSRVRAGLSFFAAAATGSARPGLGGLGRGRPPAQPANLIRPGPSMPCDQGTSRVPSSSVYTGTAPLGRGMRLLQQLTFAGILSPAQVPSTTAEPLVPTGSTRRSTADFRIVWCTMVHSGLLPPLLCLSNLFMGVVGAP